MTKSLREILESVKTSSVHGNLDVEICGITSDSRKVISGMRGFAEPQS